MRWFIAFLLMSFCQLHAQDNPVYISVAGGVGLGFLYGNDYVKSNQAMRSAPSIGIITEFFLNEKMSLTTGLNFVKKGSWDQGIKYIKGGVTYVTTSYTNDYKYLNVPLMIGYSTGNKFKLLSGFGFYTGFLLQHKDYYHTGLWDLQVGENNTDDYRTFDFGLAASLGFSFAINDNTQFFLLARHNVGLTNTFAYELDGGGSLKTSLTEILVGARISVK